MRKKMAGRNTCLKVADLFAAGVRERSAQEKKIKQEVALSDDDEERLRVDAGASR